MRAFALIHTTGGVPELDLEVTPYHGYVLCAAYQSWGLYLLSGTGAQLLAIAALPAAKVVPLCLVSQGESQFPELNDVILPAVRTKLNTWLTARGFPTIPTGAKYGVIIKAICNRRKLAWTREGTYVDEPSGA